MKYYTFKELQKDFPSDEVCLEYIFKQKYPNLEGYYPVKGRKSYVDAQGKQIHPLANTIFEKSSTPLVSWFYAIFLFSSSRNGVSAKELERQVGVTYKTAWRMAKQIRSLMKDGDSMLSGVVEVDETYFGGKDKMENGRKNKSAVMGMVERQGKIKAKQIENRQTHIILNNIKENIEKGSYLMTDEFKVYTKTPKLGYGRGSIKHGRKHYVRGLVHTNTIEGFWGQLKRSISGTYHSVSSKHLQSYVDEFSFRYNLRQQPQSIFYSLMKKV